MLSCWGFDCGDCTFSKKALSGKPSEFVFKSDLKWCLWGSSAQIRIRRHLCCQIEVLPVASVTKHMIGLQWGSLLTLATWDVFSGGAWALRWRNTLHMNIFLLIDVAMSFKKNNSKEHVCACSTTLFTLTFQAVLFRPDRVWSKLMLIGSCYFNFITLCLFCVIRKAMFHACTLCG